VDDIEDHLNFILPVVTHSCFTASSHHPLMVSQLKQLPSCCYLLASKLR